MSAQVGSICQTPSTAGASGLHAGHIFATAILACLTNGETADSCCGRLPWSLAGRRLPKFYLVAFWIDDPGKLPVLGIVNLLENVAAFFA